MMEDGEPPQKTQVVSFNECVESGLENSHRQKHTGSSFLKNYIYIILLFYREPYQKYKILTKNPLQYIKITSIFSRSLGKAYIQKIYL